MTADQYFKALDGDRKADMELLRALIKKAFPEVIEDMSYKLPTYSVNGLRICAIANQKHYIALYIMNYDLLAKFKNELTSFNCGKSCIRFKELNTNTYDLFDNILRYILENIKSSEFYKK